MKYQAKMTGGPEADFATITEARRWAESFGDTYAECYIYTRTGKCVAIHERDRNGNGRRWFKAYAG